MRRHHALQVASVDAVPEESRALPTSVEECQRLLLRVAAYQDVHATADATLQATWECVCAR